MMMPTNRQHSTLNGEKFKGKKVYGIICLNNPTKELILRVHNDKRMRLFEYRISYTEL